ncbi:hypothetical protein [Tomitella cavernea]|uniref:SipW-cognate class signal peptide n=1 Tax=Tomitella cavernea TaxID=1387982 RepID=A0ABP9C8D4_9ACTN|nr:hypothetical protein [Tomitella cavernea]
MKSPYKWGLAGALVLLLGFVSIQQTGALWSDSEALPGAVITTGTLDISAGAEGQAAFDLSDFAKPDMAPGDAATKPLKIFNSGDVGMQYRLADVALTGQGAVGVPPLDLTIVQVGSDADCTAGAPAGEQLYAGGMADATTLLRTLAPGADEVLCLTATLGSDPQTGQSATAEFTFDAQQV